MSGQHTPETLFPIEIWYAIFSHISHTEDLISLEKTYDHFRVILKERRCDYLFHKILPVSWMFMSQNANLACRLVSTSWRAALDKQVEKQLILEPLPYHDDDDDTRTSVHTLPVHAAIASFLASVDLSYHFGNALNHYQKVSQFLDSMSDHDGSRSPFIGNVLTLRLSTLTTMDIIEDNLARRMPNIVQRDTIFWQDLLRLLEKFGHHLSSLTMLISNNAYLADSMNISLCLYSRLNSLTPRLKSFRVSGIVPTYVGKYEWPGTLGSPLLHTFEIKLSSNVVPNNISPGQVDGVRTCLQSIPVMGVKRLLQTWNIWYSWDLKSLQWYGLSELYLTEIGTSMDVASVVNANLPNLVRLGLKPEYGGAGYNFTDAIHILTGLCSKSPFCRFVNVGGFSSHELIGIGSCVPAQIRHLEIIEEFGYGFLGPDRLDFLAHFVCIESLKITWIGDDDVDRLSNFYANPQHDITDVNKIICGKIKVKHARIWGLLPNLKFLCIKDKLYRKDVMLQ